MHCGLAVMSMSAIQVMSLPAVGMLSFVVLVKSKHILDNYEIQA